MQGNNPVMYGYFFIGFSDFLLKNKISLDNTSLLSPRKGEKNDKIILKYFQ